MKKLQLLAAIVIATFASSQVNAQVMHTVGNVQLEALPTSTTDPNVITSDALGNLSYRSTSSLFPASTAWDLTGNTVTGSEWLGTINAFPLRFYTSNLQRMSIEQDGRLGLGTTAPDPNSAFHIVTGSNPGQLKSRFTFERNDGTNQAGVFSLGISGSIWPLYASTIGGGSVGFKLDDPFGNSQNSDMVFSTNATAPQFIIKHSGRVGIGTTSPSANFHTIGTARLESLPTSTTNTDILTTDVNGNVSTQSAASLFPATSGWDLTGNSITGTEVLGTTNPMPLNIITSNTTRMTVDTNGLVGIGTTTPTVKLDIEQGTVRVNRITSDNTNPHVRVSDDDNATDFGSISNATGATGYFIPSFTGKSDVTGWNGSGNASNMYVIVNADDNQTTSRRAAMAFDARNYNNTGPLTSKDLFSWGSFVGSPAGTGATYMSMDAQGKLGIGTTNPTEKLDVQNGSVRIGNVTTPIGYKLYVEQGILTEKVMVALASSASWADYVFANDYKLQPLSEVETFIKENKHLPNVPSAEDLQKEGIDLGKMQAKQMEKIEELTLYLIEMKKEIEVLKAQNAVLKTKN